jgi:hypothetical protein
MIRRVSKKRQRELRKKIPQLQQGYGARPPKEWWNGMLKIVKQGYPNRNLQAQSRIAAGIWHSYSPQAKISIIRRLARGSGGIPREENPQRSQYWQTHRKWTREEKKEYKKFLKSREPKRRVYGPTWAPPLVEDYLSGEFDPMEQNPLGYKNVVRQIKDLIEIALTDFANGYMSDANIMCANAEGLIMSLTSKEFDRFRRKHHELYQLIHDTPYHWSKKKYADFSKPLPKLAEQNPLKDDVPGAHYYSFMTTTEDIKLMVRLLENTHALVIQADYEDAGTVKVRNKNGKVVFWAICKGGDVWIVRHPEDLFQPDSKVITEQNPYYYKLYPPYDVFYKEKPLAGGDIMGPFKTERGAKVAQEKRARLGVEQNPRTLDDIVDTIRSWEREVYMYVAKRQYGKARESLLVMEKIMFASLTQEELDKTGCLELFDKARQSIDRNMADRPSGHKVTSRPFKENPKLFNKVKQIFCDHKWTFIQSDKNHGNIFKCRICGIEKKATYDMPFNSEQNPLLSPEAEKEFARRQTQRQPQLPVQYTGHQEPRTVYWIAGRDTPLQQFRIQNLIRELENIYHKKIIVVERHTSSIKGGGRVPSGWEFQVVG